MEKFIFNHPNSERLNLYYKNSASECSYLGTIWYGTHSEY